MTQINATAAALAGIQANLQLMNAAAGQLANPETQAALAESMVTLKIAQQGVAVNAEVVRAMDESLGTLIDILA
jgi:hypothetical protein